MNLAALLTVEFLGVAMVFARIGAALMFVPAFGESFVPVRHRLAFAILLSLAFYPLVPVGPLSLSDPAQLIGSFAIEITLGIWFGMTARILLSTLQFVGDQIGLTIGLSNAFSSQLGSFQGGTMISTGLTLGGLAVIFATDLHHLIIDALLLGYDVFPPGRIMPGDLAQQMIRAAGQSFYLGLSIAAPFYVMGLLANLGMGLAARMMPALPVFFVAAPVLIAAGLLVLAMATPVMLREFAERLAQWLGLLVF